LVICGNAKVLGKQFRSQPSLWVNLLCHYKKYELVVEGALSNLRQCHITFSKPMRLPSNYFARGPIAAEMGAMDEAARQDRGNFDMDYYRGPPQYGGAPGGMPPAMQMPPPDQTMHAPARYFQGPAMYSQPLSSSQRSSDRSQGSLERTKKTRGRDKNLRRQGVSQSQNSAVSNSQGYMQNLMSQESYTAFDDFQLTSQSQSQTQDNTQDL